MIVVTLLTVPHRGAMWRLGKLGNPLQVDAVTDNHNYHQHQTSGQTQTQSPTQTLTQLPTQAQTQLPTQTETQLHTQKYSHTNTVTHTLKWSPITNSSKPDTVIQDARNFQGHRCKKNQHPPHILATYKVFRSLHQIGFYATSKIRSAIRPGICQMFYMSHNSLFCFCPRKFPKS